MEYIFDTQLLIEGKDLSEDAIHDYIAEHFEGDCLLAVGDDECIKIHFPHERAVEGAGIIARPWATFTMWCPKTCGGRRTAWKL